MEEVWKQIPDYPKYQASNLGRIRGPRGIKAVFRNPSGYLQTRLQGPTVAVHVIICRTFHGPKPYPNAQACHKDHKRDNNTEGNLFWGAPKENSEGRIAAGRQFKGRPTETLRLINKVLDPWRRDECDSPTEILLEVDAIVQDYFKERLSPNIRATK